LDTATRDFEDPTVDLTVSGGAARPWAYDSNSVAACEGSLGITAGRSKGVDTESIFTITAPAGATSMTYSYSYPSALDRGDDFHVLIDGNLERSYEAGPGATCATDCIDVLEGALVQFRCQSGGNNEICSIDHIQFYGSARRRNLHHSGISPVSDPEPQQAHNPISEYEYDFSSSSEPACGEETAGQTCSDTSPDKFNCCLNSKNYACGTCSSCDGWGQLLNGRDEMGKSCCDNSYLAENTTVKCLGEYGEIHYDMCCKTTTRTNKQRPQDFYCFLDRGSAEGNYAYCLGLADNPPDILALQPKNIVQVSTMLRAQSNQNNSESTTSRMKDLTLVLFFSFLCLFFYKKLVARYTDTG